MCNGEVVSEAIEKLATLAQPETRYSKKHLASIGLRSTLQNLLFHLEQRRRLISGASATQHFFDARYVKRCSGVAPEAASLIKRATEFVPQTPF